MRCLNQITILFVGRNNLTVLETTGIGSVLVKEIRPADKFPTSSAGPRQSLM